jgi:hypothetical protein
VSINSEEVHYGAMGERASRAAYLQDLNKIITLHKKTPAVKAGDRPTIVCPRA